MFASARLNPKSLSWQEKLAEAKHEAIGPQRGDREKRLQTDDAHDKTIKPHETTNHPWDWNS